MWGCPVIDEYEAEYEEMNWVRYSWVIRIRCMCRLLTLKKDWMSNEWNKHKSMSGLNDIVGAVNDIVGAVSKWRLSGCASTERGGSAPPHVNTCAQTHYYCLSLSVKQSHRDSVAIPHFPRLRVLQHCCWHGKPRMVSIKVFSVVDYHLLSDGWLVPTSGSHHLVGWSPRTDRQNEL